MEASVSLYCGVLLNAQVRENTSLEHAHRGYI